MKSIFPTIVDELEARTRIHDTLTIFCRGVDRKDWTLLLSAFHDDAIDNHGSVKGPAHEVLVPTLQLRHANITHSAHYLTNIAIHFVSTEAASVESYVWVVQREQDPSSGTERRTLAAVRYVDLIEERAGVWRISARTLTYGDIIPLTGEHEPFALPEAFSVQTRDGSDPVEEQERRLGI